ncbi:MAG TPA: hypothetical protein EYN66_02765 [Myxococcales bacterium]|nr:hypothetical protein [Myxococcales bacterium]
MGGILWFMGVHRVLVIQWNLVPFICVVVWAIRTMGCDGCGGFGMVLGTLASFFIVEGNGHRFGCLCAAFPHTSSVVFILGLASSLTFETSSLDIARLFDSVLLCDVAQS